ncbi:MAG: hypothetical protein SCH70_14105, partial [Candidatus Methanoperedens sp.]|nr:hypothetical protein [Candidatus Methanoperedens sp.]
MDDNTSILKDFKNETNQNFNELSNNMVKHDTDAQKRMNAITIELSDIKKRLSILESAKV